MKRAHHPDQKEMRRQTILEGALQLFEELPFADIRMTDLAQRLGLAKGTLYLYFPTKEALFLSLLQDRMEAWFGRANARLALLSCPAETDAVAEALVESLQAEPRLPDLLALLPSVLEMNVQTVQIRAFKHFLLQHMQPTSATLERLLPTLGPGGGFQAFLRMNALVIGIQQMSIRSPAMELALEEPGLAIFVVDFHSMFNASLKDLLRGMVAPCR